MECRSRPKISSSRGRTPSGIVFRSRHFEMACLESPKNSASSLAVMPSFLSHLFTCVIVIKFLEANLLTPWNVVTFTPPGDC